MVKALRWAWAVVMSVFAGIIAWILYNRERDGQDNRELIKENEDVIEEGRKLNKKIRRYLRG